MVNNFPQDITGQAGCFKRWSRKGYAIFVSLGNVVHIGCLSIALLQCIGQLLLRVETMLEQTLKLGAEQDVDEPAGDESKVLLLVSAKDECIAGINNKMI